MCLLGLLLHVCTDIPFLAIHNRDEFIDRPVDHPVILHEEDDIIFAKDLEKGGTWLGYNRRTGVFAALTNVRDRSAGISSPTSRGQLVLSILRGDGANGPTLYEMRQSCDAATADGIEKGSIAPSKALHGIGRLDLRHEYAGFNLVVADLSKPDSDISAFFVTNRPVHHGPVANGTAVESSSPASGPSGTQDKVAADFYSVPTEKSSALPPHAAEVQRIGPGVHVLSNSTLNDAQWAKVRWVREQLTSAASGFPLLAEVRQRYSRNRRPTGSEHASDMGIPATTRPHEQEEQVGSGSGQPAQPLAATSSSSQAAEAAAHHSAPRQHKHHHWEGDADVEEKAEAALIQEVLTSVVSIMYVQAPVKRHSAPFEMRIDFS